MLAETKFACEGKRGAQDEWFSDTEVHWPIYQSVQESWSSEEPEQDSQELKVRCVPGDISQLSLILGTTRALLLNHRPTDEPKT